MSRAGKAYHVVNGVVHSEPDRDARDHCGNKIERDLEVAHRPEVQEQAEDDGNESEEPVCERSEGERY